MHKIYIMLLLLFLLLPGSILPQNKNTKKNIPAGFGNLGWGTLVSSAKGQVIGKIVFTDDNKVIISRDNDIEYLYGFFYIDPAVMKKTSASGATEGKLFYVSVKFPYLSMEDVKKKVEEKYGTPSGESINDNQGALLWDSEKTTVILWVDKYERKPYCRKITYIAKEIAKEINEYQKKVFNSKELEIMEKLSP